MIMTGLIYVFNSHVNKTRQWSKAKIFEDGGGEWLEFKLESFFSICRLKIISIFSSSISLKIITSGTNKPNTLLKRLLEIYLWIKAWLVLSLANADAYLRFYGMNEGYWRLSSSGSRQFPPNNPQVYFRNQNILIRLS